MPMDHLVEPSTLAPCTLHYPESEHSLLLGQSGVCALVFESLIQGMTSAIHFVEYL
jgi:hypothetical protein